MTASNHQRTILIADFELPRGAVAIEHLMAMPRAAWGHLRSQINLRWQQDRSSPLARCRICEGGVFIRSQATRDGHVPMFAHFPDGSKVCPWYDGGNMRLDDARAAQYQGHQESALHRRLCETIRELAKADRRHVHAAVDTYLRPAIHKRGRWPDVYLEMGMLGRFALEVQLSKPFAPEIAARHLHYDAEGVSLIWIFNTLEDPMPQGFHDVITMQRGNAFVFDDEAEAVSIKRGTLILKCYFEDGHGRWREPRLVALDDMQTGHGRSAFVEDCRTEFLKAFCKGERSRWWTAFKAARKERPNSPFYSDEFEPPWAALQALVPGLAEWEGEFWKARSDKARVHAAMLYAMLCSVVRSSETGKPTLYITKFAGDSAVLSMLNSKLNGADFRHCSDLFAAFLQSSRLADLLERPSLRKIMTAAREADAQIGQDHPLWRAMARLFPEVLDGLVRAELDDLDQLPAWSATPAPSIEERDAVQ
ncbi:MAG: hypothetical protein ABI193_26210 [Minicystis sp.]